MSELVASYRLLVGALLDHTFIGHEGTDLAIGDFRASGDRALGILDSLLAAQTDEWQGREDSP